MILLVACLLSIFAEYAVAVGPLVELGYARYNGVELGNGVTQWLGLPYAAPPLGPLRFAAPADITIENREYQAYTASSSKNHHGPACIGVDSSSNSLGDSSSQVSEDCLTLDIYAPASATAESQLPVYLYIPGGGFSVSGLPPNGSTLVHNSGHEIIYVSLTYRVGPYGFLTGDSSDLVAEAGTPQFSYNNGLKDQLKALHWVKENIQSFGGNPSHLVIGGASAGAGSVVLHVSNPETSALLAGATAESASWPPLLTPEEGDYIFSNISALTSCSASVNALACLRALPASALQQLIRGQRFRLPGAPETPLFAYAPTLDGDLVREYTYEALWQAHRSRGHTLPPLLLGATSHDGATFAPASAGTALYAADAFITSQFPRLSATDLAWLHAHPYYAPLIQSSNFRAFAARAFGSLRYACPALFVAWAVPSRAHSPAVWLYRWDVGAAGHVAEQGAVFRGAGAAGGDVAAIEAAANIQAYFVSFVRFLDPNPGRAAGAPLWGATGGDEVGRGEDGAQKRALVLEVVVEEVEAGVGTGAVGGTEATGEAGAAEAAAPAPEDTTVVAGSEEVEAAAVVQEAGEAEVPEDNNDNNNNDDDTPSLPPIGTGPAPAAGSSTAATTWLPQRMLFTDHAEEEGAAATRMEMLDATQWEQCVYLVDRGIVLQQ
ncbi:uncharacterized protein K452DRAFT_360734 [Aplosporella prunicola CBS 121167]|uniref:Carboxylic ester hydrolase n=1 Tax=Aplosporella prunicola CBS 121167 TaxID=1176127 RepID=A0A6A6B7S1_9PEZI|nr:uncharacterized protein K452DRAFT_360734 [Aplosporella prunicola CBS 121167]KAF2138987.1 hypothetical protein K452DRAFT_360734 [Aplosporella prunicola CBS 121167]